MKILLFWICLVLFVGNQVKCWRIPVTNDIWDYNPEFDHKKIQGPERIAIDVVDEDEDEGEEEEEEDQWRGEPEVDEETIRKAEKMADEDLLKGLNRILKNNETLEDVLEAENIHEFP